MEFRTEKDTMGEVQVPVTAYYGAQTQRSIENFKIAQDINRMPKEIIRAFAYLKKAAALANFDAGVIPKNKAALIGKVSRVTLNNYAGPMRYEDNLATLAEQPVHSGGDWDLYCGPTPLRPYTGQADAVCPFQRAVWVVGAQLHRGVYVAY